MQREIITTADGSRTIRLPEIDEQYHSIHGARTESQYIFVEQALRPRLSEPLPAPPIQLLEVGFGTGLNALLSLLCVEEHKIPLLYETYELYPLERPIIEALFTETLTPSELELMLKLHDATWGTPIHITPYFTILKQQADLVTATLPPHHYDVIYMDAFAPEKSPLLWQEPFLQKLFNASCSNARLSTYCAKGVVRRLLTQVGFEVHRTPGPPQGKREILTARTPSI